MFTPAVSDHPVLPLLALDVGGTSIKWARMRAGVCEEEGVVATERGPVGVTHGIGRLVDAHGLPYALAIAGDIAPDGMITHCGSLGLVDYSPRQELPAAGYRPPVLCVNDATAAAAGEAMPGGTLACVTVGTGIGGKLVLDGRVLVGERGSAGEVGHLSLDPVSGRVCDCGIIGCSERYGGWRGMREHWLGADAPDGPGDILARAQAGEEQARRVLTTALDAIAFAANALVTAADPGEVVLCGGVAAAWGPVMADGVQSRIHAHSWAGRHTRVRVSALGTRAAMLGLSGLAAASGEDLAASSVD